LNHSAYLFFVQQSTWQIFLGSLSLAMTLTSAPDFLMACYPGMWSRSRHFGLETVSYQRLVSEQYVSVSAQ